MPNLIFSSQVSKSVLLKIAKPAFNGAGKKLGKSNVLNSRFLELGLANIIAWSFHCNLSSIFKSLNKFIILGYAPKKTCNPVSVISLSASLHAATFPPKRDLASNTIGVWPASTICFAVDNPASPPPITAIRWGVDGRGKLLIKLMESLASLNGLDVFSRFGRGMSCNTVLVVGFETCDSYGSYRKPRFKEVVAVVLGVRKEYTFESCVFKVVVVKKSKESFILSQKNMKEDGLLMIRRDYFIVCLSF
mmetsp:Transcript_15371/g.18702  ORF Transcript_15371/g.18702 Transcript_15371/m.18702 type:complete len:248 (+) Transcript_15371:1305-2048(+)